MKWNSDLRCELVKLYFIFLTFCWIWKSFPHFCGFMGRRGVNIPTGLLDFHLEVMFGTILHRNGNTNRNGKTKYQWFWLGLHSITRWVAIAVTCNHYFLLFNSSIQIDSELKHCSDSWFSFMCSIGTMPIRTKCQP